MVGRILALLLLAELGTCQENSEAVRRLRFRRPRPKLIDVENPEGDLVGRPVELGLEEAVLADAEDLVAAAQNARQSFPARDNSGSAALDALIATAQREEPALPAPQQLEIEEVTRATPRRVTRPRNRGQTPPRNRDRQRPRPSSEQSVVANGGARRRPAAEREEPVGTLERYSHKNDDGSFTFGYVGADGSFREETRGADCITRGKYGYIDPDGVKREYTYTSGLPCDIGEGNDLDNELDNNNVEDTVDPRERFRQTQNEQLENDRIPAVRQQQIADRQRSPQRGQRPQAAPRPQPTATQANTFSNFGNGGSQGNALNNLLTIADPAPAPATPAPRAPNRGPIRIATRPQAAQPAQAAPGTFDFDSELEGFTLNRPAIKFDNAAGSPQNQFESQLSFNQNTGVFQTSVKQSLPGGGLINTVNNAAPTGQAATTLQPRPTTRAPPPRPTTVRPTTILQTQRPSSRQPAQNSILPAGTIQLQPTFKPLSVPQDIGQARPAPVAEAPRSASPAPLAVLPSPTPAPKAAPAPVKASPVASAPAPQPAAPLATPQPQNNKFFVFQPFNQQPASQPFRTPINHDAFRIQPQPLSAGPPQSPPSLISQGGRPISSPIPPPQPPRSLPAPVARPLRPQAIPQPIRPQAAQPLRPQAAQPLRPQAAQPLRPQPAQPLRPAAPRPAPVPQSRLPPGVFAVPAGQPIPAGAIRVNTAGQAINVQGQLIPEPARAPVPEQPRRPAGPPAPRPAPQGAPQTPQLQFGFQPVSQGAQSAPRPAPRPAPQGAPRPVARPPVGAPRPGGPGRPAPFTAFGGGAPRPQAPQFQARPQQLGVPPQLQQPGQFSQFDSRFAPRPQQQGQFRPAQFQPSGQGFNVFNPAQLRGA